MADCPIDDKVIKYADYLVDNYLTADCDYPPKIWASESSSLQRTTNTCASFHANFNRSFYKESPSIFNLLEVLIDEVQTETYIKLRSVHLPNVTQDRSIRERKSKNEKYITDYQNLLLDRYSKLLIKISRRYYYLKINISLKYCNHIFRYDFVKLVSNNYFKTQ